MKLYIIKNNDSCVRSNNVVILANKVEGGFIEILSINNKKMKKISRYLTENVFYGTFELATNIIITVNGNNYYVNEDQKLFELPDTLDTGDNINLMFLGNEKNSIEMEPFLIKNKITNAIILKSYGSSHSALSSLSNRHMTNVRIIDNSKEYKESLSDKKDPKDVDSVNNESLSNKNIDNDNNESHDDFDLDSNLSKLIVYLNGTMERVGRNNDYVYFIETENGKFSIKNGDESYYITYLLMNGNGVHILINDIVKKKDALKYFYKELSILLTMAYCNTTYFDHVVRTEFTMNNEKNYFYRTYQNKRLVTYKNDVETLIFRYDELN